MIKDTKGDRIFDAVVVVLLTLLLLLVAYPMYFVIIASVSDPGTVVRGQVVLFPAKMSFAGYQKVIEHEQIWIGYRNTLVYMVIKTSIATLITLLAGFALSRKSLKWRGIIIKLMTFTMFFSGGLIPQYLLMNSLHLTGTRWAVIILGCVSVYNIIISRTFMQSNIPDELVEAASIDGCRPTYFFFRIALPLSPALIAVLVLFNAVGEWNAWFNAMIYLRNENHVPLQMVVRDLIAKTSGSMSDVAGDTAGEDMSQAVLMTESIKYAVIIVSSFPIMCIYPFVQKYFVKGVMVGSIKG